MLLKLYTLELTVQLILLVVKISTVLSQLSYQIYVIVHTEIVNTYFVFLFDSCKGCFYVLAVACTNRVFS